MQESSLFLLLPDLFCAGILIWLMRNNPVERALLLFAGFAIFARVIGFIIGGSFGLYGGPGILLGLAGASALLFAVTRGWNPFDVGPMPTAAQATLAVPLAPSAPKQAVEEQAKLKTTAQTFCSNCGVSNVLEDRFCAECGSGL
jgi:zinc-ribbon domain